MKKILIVEDDADARFLLESLLSNRGFEVRAVETGAEARAEMHHAFFDLVLMDLLLPDTDGITLCEEFKGQRVSGFMPIIVLSAVSHESVIHQALSRGADDFMPKPPALVDLVGRIHRWLDAAQDPQREPKAPSVRVP